MVQENHPMQGDDSKKLTQDSFVLYDPDDDNILLMIKEITNVAEMHVWNSSPSRIIQENKVGISSEANDETIIFESENIHCLSERNNVGASLKVKRKRLYLNGSMSCTYPVRFKAYITILLLLFLVSSCRADDNKPRSYQFAKVDKPYKSLSTPNCNPGTLDMTQSCHVEGSDLTEMLIDRCNFKDECEQDYTPVCVDIDGGMVFICAPMNIQCSEGYRWNVKKDQENHSNVHVIVEKCPHGSFQQGSSDCFHACKSKHKDLVNIPEWYTIFTEGDNINPTFVYCNYTKGFFNREGQFLLDYDRDSEHNPYFCVNVNDNNPCVEGQMPLPNGTCVPPCKKHECRDDHNNFICKRNCRDQTKDKHSFTEIPGLEEDKDECDGETRVCQYGICKISFNEAMCQCYPGFEYDKMTRRCLGSDVSPKTTTKHLETWHIILIVCCFTLIIITVCVILFKRKKCKSRSPQVEEGNDQSKNSFIVTEELSTETESNGSSESAENVTIKTKQACLSLVFKEAQNINITNNYVQYGVKDQCITDYSPWENDSTRITANEESFASQVASPDLDEYEPRLQTTKKNVSSCDTISEDENEHLLTDYKNDADRFAMSNVRDFKKDINDINTQAEVRCLIYLMLSCGAIVHRGHVKGSAFRAGSKYVITAFHVITDIVRDLTGRDDYDFLRLEKECVTINFNESVLHSHKRDILLRYCYHNEEYDFAVLEIKDIDLHENIPDPLLLWKYDISYMNGKQVTLIGYGHAGNPNAKHEETCVIIEENDFSLRHREALASLNQNRQEYKANIPGYDKSSVDRGYCGVDSEAFIKFDCFMEKGLSGGPVITNEGNSPKVIGIVRGGMPDFYYKLPPEKQVSFKRKYLFEVGVKMQLIYEKMRTENPDLASELFPKD